MWSNHLLSLFWDINICVALNKKKKKHLAYFDVCLLERNYLCVKETEQRRENWKRNRDDNKIKVASKIITHHSWFRKKLVLRWILVVYHLFRRIAVPGDVKTVRAGSFLISNNHITICWPFTFYVLDNSRDFVSTRWIYWLYTTFQSGFLSKTIIYWRANCLNWNWSPQ